MDVIEECSWKRFAEKYLVARTFDNRITTVHVSLFLCFFCLHFLLIAFDVSL